MRICAEIRLIPAMSTTEYIIVMSAAPTYGRVSPEASVETISFGTPTGSARIARAAIDELPEPPTRGDAVEAALGVQPREHGRRAARPWRRPPRPRSPAARERRVVGAGGRARPPRA